MEKPNFERNHSLFSDQSKAVCKDLTDEQEKLRILREQLGSVRLQQEGELSRWTLEFPITFPGLRTTGEKRTTLPHRSNFFTKLRIGKLLE